MQTSILQTTLSKEPPMEDNIPDEGTISDTDGTTLIEAAVPKTVRDCLGQKKRKSGQGTTAKALENCQQEIQQHRKTLIQCQTEQNATQVQILEKYTRMRKLQEEFITATKEHREIIRQQREKTNDILIERNNLLKELVEVIKNNQS